VARNRHAVQDQCWDAPIDISTVPNDTGMLLQGERSDEA
jgi:hypothetical protein